jgi:uncharacterized protein YqgQ
MKNKPPSAGNSDVAYNDFYVGAKACKKKLCEINHITDEFWVFHHNKLIDKLHYLSAGIVSLQERSERYAKNCWFTACHQCD